MEVKVVSFEEWRQFVEGLPGYNFFHLPVWAEAHQKSYPGRYKTATKLFIFDNGIQVLVPLIEEKSRYRFKHLFSSLKGGYGGFLFNKKPGVEHLKQILKHILSKEVLSLEVYPEPSALETSEFFRNYKFESRKVFTHILELGKPEALWDNFTYACKKNIKRAQKEDLTLVKGDFADLEHYYKMYLDSVKRWDLAEEKILPLIFFQNLLQIGEKDIKLFFVEKCGEKVAGVIMFYGKTESFQWHAVSFYKYENIRPNNFWEWELIKDSYNRGYGTHNFGASVGLPGVERFKESFGAKRIEYECFTYKNQLFKFYNKLR